MLKRRKKIRKDQFVPSCSLAPTGPFIMNYGDPVTIALTRKVEASRREMRSMPRVAGL